ncbi:MAG: NUDIX hydrolase [Woronichinia naegeliana WA131]|jgi:8-oxo-dGTP diphosphatase|uniref:NUDIX hydrolase n=1 Tax=Woronichinia naegeliana WA131 TaxID=2824559 RepID=A0A977KWZ0_9CYAN|nr:MAG: NUDIX hydrolase [Woronichinia naegeliana WA131]
MLQVQRYAKAFLKVAFRHPITGTTIIPILPDGRIVLIQRRDTGQWGLPGGLVDWGEELLSTAQRELKEETGLNFLKIQRLVGVYSAPDRDPRMHSISIVIAAQVEGEVKTEDSLEVMDVKAFTREELPLGNLSHDHDRQLNDFLAGAIIVA